MRESFKKGYTYIVRDKTRSLWYIVQQTGDKSWFATSFATIVGVGFEDRIIKGNGAKLYADLGANRFFSEGFLAFRTNSDHYQTMFRKNMFTILRKGRFYQAGDE